MTALQRVQEVLATQLDLPLAAVAPEFDIAEQMARDSLDMMEITVVLEREFGIRFEDRELTTVRTVQDLADAVERELLRSRA